MRLLVSLDIWSDLGYMCCDITLWFVIDSAGHYLFCKLCLSWHSVHHLLSPVWKCNNVRDPCGVSIFLATGQPWPQYISSQNLGKIVYTMKKRRMWMIWGSMWLMCEMEWNTALLTIPLTSDADFYVPVLEPQDDIMIFTADSDWGCFRGCAISSSLGAPFWMYS